MKNSQSSFAFSFLALIAAGLSLTACAVDSSDEMLDEEQDSIAEEEQALTGKQELNGGPWTWVNGVTGLCLDSNSAGSVYALGCNGGNFQRWTNKQYGTVDEIRDYATGRCLDSDYNGKVYTLPCNNNNYQRWSVTAMSGGGYEIRSLQTGRCLEGYGGSVYTWLCHGGNYQRWH
ncbi:MAG TPA: RICIN domain-containing protein [Polyangium sp.]|nr:RICIN domain-containing protein [Polyangium sp.]